MQAEAYKALLAKEHEKALELYTALEKQKDPVSLFHAKPAQAIAHLV